MGSSLRLPWKPAKREVNLAYPGGPWRDTDPSGILRGPSKELVFNNLFLLDHSSHLYMSSHLITFLQPNEKHL